MIRSLYSGSSGMKNHQVRMDVIGNNIANVNTTGFKSSRANFQDAVYQLLRSPSAPSDDTSGAGSINPSQVGTGMSIASIGINMGQGPIQNTGRPLDLAIQGNGFFCVTDGTNCYYTRNGVFYIDKNGFLVDSNGNQLVDGSGGSGTPGAPIQLGSGTDVVSTISIGKDGAITATNTAGDDISPSINIGLYSFANQEGLKQIGQSYYQEVTGTSGEATPIDPDDVGVYSEIASCYLEMSNVNLSDEFVDMITTQRGYQANGRVITISDQMLQELLDLKR
ncbi:Flagellar basal-body rod protein FlgG [Pelotomaculum schinkii]|uniref:Flagellar hook protein FlgE n=1 Tax=Pelotomaculum schinkii TaxID=78350 RepID=A0A4Y7R8G5_9FIRM|nr:flagellar hook-basal body complex protein [Pelotomaculum schinkii]TEB04941.1 Flagellar basal-body rod protein FlgG [Pelotomaculum schinkii]